jgi:hypothetical protein
MKTSTGKMLLDCCRNVKGIVSIFERWVRREAGILGTVDVVAGKPPDERGAGKTQPEPVGAAGGPQKSV